MASKPIFIVVSQRSNGQCFVDCELHRATSFAVKKQWKEKGRVFLSTLSRHSTKTQADGEVAYRTRSVQPIRKYVLGSRIPKKEQLI